MARATERDEAAEEAGCAAAKPDIEAASSIVAYACSRWESKTWAWSLEASCWWREDGKGEIWDPLWAEKIDRMEERKLFTVTQSSNFKICFLFFFFL